MASSTARLASSPRFGFVVAALLLCPQFSPFFFHAAMQLHNLVFGLFANARPCVCVRSSFGALVAGGKLRHESWRKLAWSPFFVARQK